MYTPEQLEAIATSAGTELSPLAGTIIAHHGIAGVATSNSWDQPYQTKDDVAAKQARKTAFKTFPAEIRSALVLKQKVAEAEKELLSITEYKKAGPHDSPYYRGFASIGHLAPRADTPLHEYSAVELETWHLEALADEILLNKSTI